MQTALDQFNSNMERVRSLGGLHSAISGILSPIVDKSDILRAQYVMAVSALDHYVHQVVRLGMLEIFDGKRPPTSAYQRFKVSLRWVTFPATLKAMRDELEAEIREQHSYLTFQRPEKIADAVRLICEKPLWDCVAQNLVIEPKAIKQQLTLVIDRRNKIAHEADLDPTYPNTKWPIEASDLDSVSNTIEGVVLSVHKTIC